MRDCIDIDIFSKSIIRRQFAMISTYNEAESDSLERAAVFVTALENKFDYIIHKGKSDNCSITPFCFAIFNNTKDMISNKHWQRTMTNFAQNIGCGFFIVGYDDLVLREPICFCGENPLLSGTIKMLKLVEKASRSRQKRLVVDNQTPYITATYAELLNYCAEMLSGKSKITFSTDYPFVVRKCLHKTQPTLTANNTTAYYEKRKYFDGFYPSGYYNYACSIEAMNRARELLTALESSHC